MPTKNIAVSIVIPLYNEAETVPKLFRALNALRRKLPSNTEVILVDDGSRDHTLEQLQKTSLSFPKIILQLSRNFGHQAALLAGLEVSRGTYVVTMDGDLQHPPILIPAMLAANRHVDIVLTQREDTDWVPLSKRVTSFLFYHTINAVSNTPITLNASDFRSMNRRALQSLLSLPERRKFLRGMVQWIGFSSLTLPFTVQKRQHGQSKYSFRKMWELAFHGITSFSAAPLYLSWFCSILLFAGAFVYAVYVLYIRFVVRAAVNGWASLVFVTLVIGGFTFLFLGLIGIYIAAIYDEVKARPLYIVKELQKQPASRTRKKL